GTRFARSRGLRARSPRDRPKRVPDSERCGGQVTMTEAQLPPRARVAVAAGKLTGAVSRAAGRGSGAVVGGRVALRLDPELLRRLTAGRSCVLVSATNG